MHNDIKDYLAFLAVAQEGSFTRAAVRLNVSQSTLSHTLRRLEERIGIKLLMRTTRTVSTTELGEKFRQAIEPRFEAIQEDIDRLLGTRGLPAGTIRLSVSDHMIHSYIWPRLSPILNQYPDIKLELSQQNEFVDIVEGRFDAGVRIGNDVVKDMIATRIGPDWSLYVIGSKEYLAEHGIPQHPSELTNHNCINIRHSAHSGIYRWEFQDNGEIFSQKVEGQLIFTSVYPMLAAVEDGYGLALVPEDIAEEGIQKGRWQRVLAPWSPTFPGYHLYYPSRRQISPAMRIIIESLRYAKGSER